MRFKINFGQHSQRNADGEMVTYRAGDIVETDHDLASEFPIVDVATGTPRFILVDDGDDVPAKPVFKVNPKKGKK